MLNAMLTETIIPIHRHPMSNENVLLLIGKLDEVIYDDNVVEIKRIHFDPSVGNFGCVVPQGTWHIVEVLEFSVIYEAKDGKYGEDGSMTLEEYKAGEKLSKSENAPLNLSNSSKFNKFLEDLKKNIEYLIGMECQSGSMDAISSLYVSHMLNVPLEDVKKAMKELGV